MEFPANEQKQKTFFETYLQNKDDDLKNPLFQKEIENNIDSILRVEQPEKKLNLENEPEKQITSFEMDEGTSSTTESSSCKDEIPTEKSQCSQGGTDKNEQQNLQIPQSSFSPSSTSISLPTPDPELAKLLYKWYEAGYMTCYYQMTHQKAPDQT
ncbi:uncharacterized protein MONOS_5186 [Monocercomonoides exilis]|uniref:uncharacterized protein n=1 Tax=Monocercomonoides exilis TaxID=2049356 RepID=UPI003559BA26|nr:hypothetical protein MONOS_5186 [Monocercomonoides exilis]|eukprot:MONOS_5186.1-p1 / transcript=MONOS_5186.1 / gene=MONOS_5186 / organism=Monocercomonoides_exilis_PA203 / gene_product=unspecified product / transcript_product=unspecified product / location=Mono_scaffold00148:50793-51335(-) / protein_length=155 / sequence_SO=supercontig / SO=protein_coding / is_pseudo=false